MINLNSVVITGAFTHDPEMKKGKNDKYSCYFQLAVDDGTNVNYISCVAFDKDAKNIVTYFVKGDRIGIQGKLQSIRKNNTHIITIKVERLEMIKTQNHALMVNF